MIYKNPNTVQQIINKVNSHKDFTYNLDDKNPISNYSYIVSVKNIFVNKKILRQKKIPISRDSIYIEKTIANSLNSVLSWLFWPKHQLLFCVRFR